MYLKRLKLIHNKFIMIILESLTFINLTITSLTGIVQSSVDNSKLVLVLGSIRYKVYISYKSYLVWEEYDSYEMISNL